MKVCGVEILTSTMLYQFTCYYLQCSAGGQPGIWPLNAVVVRAFGWCYSAASPIYSKRTTMKLINCLVNKYCMVSKAVASLAAIFLLSCVSIAQAQPSNPLASDPRAARAGGVIFRAQCATCHGADAKGISSIDAPDLTLIWAQEGSSDGSVFANIQNGIAGSIMPPHGFPDAEIWMLVSYLRSVAVAGSTEPFTGNGGRGQTLFAANCVECHRVDRDGGILGPNLSGITARRSQQALRNSIRQPSASIGRRYKPISFLSGDNRRVQGVIKSEDAFSFQIMDSNQRLRGFTKAELTQVNRTAGSLMPSFSNISLSDSDLNDILSFLNQTR